MTNHILIVEDEEKIIALLRDYLEKANYRVSSIERGDQVISHLKKTSPDLVLLDVMLPGMDGMVVCREIRKFSAVPIIMITAKVEEIDRLLGLELGADDYICKPFSPRELVARVKAALRRLQTGALGADKATLAFRRVRIDLGGRKVWVDDTPVDLTNTEFELLRVLAQHRGIVLSREQLLQQVWGYDYYGEDRVVDVHIGHIRQKLGGDRFIVTVRGVGYRFDDEEA